MNRSCQILDLFSSPRFLTRSEGHLKNQRGQSLALQERYLESKGRRTNSAIQGSCTRAIGQSGSECLTTRGFENTTRIVMREKRKRPEMDQLSSMTSTVAGPGMKSLFSSTTELRRRRDLPPATTGAVCPQTRANTLFQALRKQQNMSEVQCPSICAPFRPPRCHTVVVLAITHEEIGTKMTLTEFPTLATEKPSRSDFLSPHLTRFVDIRCTQSAFNRSALTATLRNGKNRLKL